MYHSIHKIQQQLSSETITLTEIARYYLSQIKKNSHLNAFVEVFEEETLQQAARLDKKVRQKKAGKLHGLFIAIKDNICYKDHSSTAGSAILKDFVSVYQTIQIQKLF